jgi:hypothetical protein
MIYLSEKIGYINDITKDDIIAKCNEVQKLIFGFIKSLKVNG